MTSSISGTCLQQVDLVVEERPVEDRDDRLGRVEGERAQPRAFAPGEQDGFHDNRRSYRTSRGSPTVMGRQARLQCAAQAPFPADEPAELPHARAHLPGAAAGGRAADEVRGPPDPRHAARSSWRPPSSAWRRSPTGSTATWRAGASRSPALGQMHRSAGRQAADLRGAHLARQMDWRPAWMVAVIIGREFAVTGLRSLAYARGVAMPASPLGKFKMVAQVVAILLLSSGRHVSGVLSCWGRLRCGWCVAARRGVGGRLLPAIHACERAAGRPTSSPRPAWNPARLARLQVRASGRAGLDLPTGRRPRALQFGSMRLAAPRSRYSLSSNSLQQRRNKAGPRPATSPRDRATRRGSSRRRRGR